MEQQQPEKVLFYSYDYPKDQTFQEELSDTLRPLVRNERLIEWADQQIEAGTDKSKARIQALESAHFILLLLSASYLASNNCYQEMLKALERQRQGKVRVIPILLSPCTWKQTPLAKLLPLPKNGKPVTAWGDNRSQAFLEIAEGIRQIVETHPSPSSQTFLPPARSGLVVSEQTSSPLSPAPLPHVSRLSPGSLALSSLLIKLPKRPRLPLVVAGFILLILMILGGSIFGVLTGNATRRQSATQASATARVQATAKTLVPGKIWHTQISGASKDLNAVVWSGSQFVAVGDKGTILTSPNGHTWISQPSGILDHLYAVAWSGFLFVAVGNKGTILTSPDGHAWSAWFYDPSATFYGVAWSGSLFVAVGNIFSGNTEKDGIILTSSNGHAWAARTFLSALMPGPNIGVAFVDVAWLDSQFVVVGFPNAILTSLDGHTWTDETDGLPPGFIHGCNTNTAWTEYDIFQSVAWSGSRFVIVDDGCLLTSPDGRTWTAQFDRTKILNVVVWSGSQFVAVGDNIFTSSDGYTWTAPFPGYFNTSLQGITWSGSQLVAVGTSGTILTSP
jgi:hypothetical protein